MSVTFKRYAGRILWEGDSITRGQLGDNGGWRKYVQAALEAANIGYVAVGPLTVGSTGMTQTAHNGVSGGSMNASQVATDCTTYAPNVVCLAYGMNELGTGTSSTTFLATLNSGIDNIQTLGTVKSSKILVQKVLSPTAAYAAYYANIAQYTACQAAAPAQMTSQGVTYVDVGTPAQSDGVHPSDGASGYDVMGAAMLSALLLVIP
jgi:lysophospholipase L1-like esterase